MTGSAPVLLVVGGDAKDVATTASALHHRFGLDYQIRTAGSAADGLTDLNERACNGEQVALVAADLNLPDGDGVQFLEQAAGVHRGLARILLFDMDDYTRGSRSGSCPRCSAPAHSAGSTAGW